jgi:hypothetical protein
MSTKKYLLATFLLVLSASCGGSSQTCTPGTSGCACRTEGTACDDGLACGASNTCGPPATSGFVVSDATARSCDVLLIEESATVKSMTLTSAVKGTHLREAPRVAVSFISTSDAPIPAGAVGLVLASGAASGLTIKKVTCADAAGTPIAGVTVRLE